MSFMPGQPGNQFDTLSNLASYGSPLGSGGYIPTQSPVAVASNDWMGGFNKSPVVPSFMGPDFKLGTPAVSGNGNWWDGAIGTKEAPGWGGLALGAASGLASGFMAMKQYGLAKETLEQNRKQFETNFAAQKGLTNANLEDRQRARVASNAGAYQSVGDYMAQNGVK